VTLSRQAVRRTLNLRALLKFSAQITPESIRITIYLSSFEFWCDGGRRVTQITPKFLKSKSPPPLTWLYIMQKTMFGMAAGDNNEKTTQKMKI